MERISEVILLMSMPRFTKKPHIRKSKATGEKKRGGVKKQSAAGERRWVGSVM
jgi:hypothetical protein